MKKKKIFIALSAITMLGVLNFTQSEKGFAMSEALASSSSNSSSSSSSNNPCCIKGYLVNCNQRLESQTIELSCMKIEVEDGDTIISSYTTTGTKVMCPTDGSCNNCQEYTPSC